MTETAPALPGGVDPVIRQAMSKHPDDRYLTCGEFVDALEKGPLRPASTRALQMMGKAHAPPAAR